MHRYAIRIFAEDLAGWVPLVCVVTMTSTLVGICVSQAVWTSSPAFAEATRAARLDLTGFQAVSVTIYAEVALIALFALTAVGSATVRRCHSTFAQWRLAGATPIQVRVSALSVAGLASAIGSAAGSLASLPLSSALVPAFDALAAEGFSGGLGSFEPPAFDVGALAAPLAFAVSWPTCMAGAILPALRTGRVAPVDFLRKTGADTGRSRAGTAARRVLSGLLLGLSLAILPLGALLGGNGVGAIVNGIVSAGILATLAVFAAGVEEVRLATRAAGLIPRTLGDAVGHLAAREAIEEIERDSHAVVPLAAALGGGSTLLCAARCLEEVLSRLGLPAELNYADVLVLFGLAAAFALATALATVALFGGDDARRQALLRTLGLTRGDTVHLIAWRSLILALSAALLGLMPALVAALAGATLLQAVWGFAAFQPCLDVFATALPVLWAVLFVLQRARLARPLAQSPAAVLRGWRLDR